MRKPIANAIATTFCGILPIALYWLGGGDFAREPMLAVTAGFSACFAACAWGIWSE